MTKFDDNVKKTTDNMHKATLAYVGLHNAAFQSGLEQIKKLYASGDGVFENLVATGEKLQAQSAFLFGGAEVKTTVSFDADAAKKAENIVPSLTVTRGADAQTVFETPTADVAALEAEIAALTKELSALKTSAAATVKAAGKTAAAASKATPKAATKTSAKPSAETSDKYAPYLAKVQKYDDSATYDDVKKIVTYLGIALKSRDGQLVACSDPAERDTVRDNFLVKKLGVSGQASELDAKVLSVCELMKADRLKDRVVFYYLLTQQEDKLSAL